VKSKTSLGHVFLFSLVGILTTATCAFSANTSNDSKPISRSGGSGMVQAAPASKNEKEEKLVQESERARPSIEKVETETSPSKPRKVFYSHSGGSYGVHYREMKRGE